MNSTKITCADTDERDLEARYAASQLSEDEAEAFEEHYFSCDRCWTLVQRAVEIRAVEIRAVEIRAVENRSRRATSWRSIATSRWLAIAAAATIVVAGTLSVDDWRSRGSEAVTMRGSTDSLHVVTHTRGTMLVASWTRVVEASSYRARLYSASGTVLHQREVTDTTIAVSAASLPKTAPDAELYWEIQAMNRTRQVVGRSGLRAIGLPKARK